MEVVDGAVVQDEIVGDGDWAAFLDMFDFAVVASADFGGAKWALRAACETFITEAAWGDDGDDGEAARKFVFEKFVLGPRIETVEYDFILTGGDKVFCFSDGLAADPIVPFGFADFFAELALGFGGDFDATLFHLFIE